MIGSPFTLGANTNLTTSGTAATTAAYTVATTVLVSALNDAYVAIVQGANVATSSSFLLPAGAAVFLSLGINDRVSALQVASAGVVGVQTVHAAAWN